MNELEKINDFEVYISAHIDIKLESRMYRPYFSVYRGKVFISSVMTIKNGQKIRANKLPIFLAEISDDATIRSNLKNNILDIILNEFLDSHQIPNHRSKIFIQKFLPIALNYFFEKYGTYHPLLN